MQAPQATPEPNPRDCSTETANNGQPCKHCLLHIRDLTEAGATEAELKYPAGTQPVVFNCQFIYNYDALEPHHYCERLSTNFCASIWEKLGTDISIASDIAIYKGASTWHDDQKWTVFASFLVDIPLTTKVDFRGLRSKLELGDMTPSVHDWSIDIHEDRMSEDWCWCRLKWHLKRLGIDHHPLCNESYMGHYLRVLAEEPNAFEDFLDNAREYDDSWAFE